MEAVHNAHSKKEAEYLSVIESLRTEIKDHRKQIVLNEKKSRTLIKQLQSQISKSQGSKKEKADEKEAKDIKKGTCSLPCSPFSFGEVSVDDFFDKLVGAEEEAEDYYDETVTLSASPSSPSLPSFGVNGMICMWTCCRDMSDSSTN